MAGVHGPPAVARRTGRRVGSERRPVRAAEQVGPRFGRLGTVEDAAATRGGRPVAPGQAVVPGVLEPCRVRPGLVRGGPRRRALVGPRLGGSRLPRPHVERARLVGARPRRTGAEGADRVRPRLLGTPVGRRGGPRGGRRRRRSERTEPGGAGRAGARLVVAQRRVGVLLQRDDAVGAVHARHRTAADEAGRRGRAAQDDAAARPPGQALRHGHAARVRVEPGTLRADLDHDPARRVGPARHGDAAARVHGGDVVHHLGDELQQLGGRCRGDGRGRAAAHVDAQGFVGGLDRVVEEVGERAVPVRRRPGRLAGEHQEALGVVPHPARGVEQLRQPGRGGGERIGADAVEQPGVAVDAPPQPPQDRCRRVEAGVETGIEPRVAAGSRTAGRDTRVTVAARGGMRTAGGRRVTFRRERPVGHPSVPLARRLRRDAASSQHGLGHATGLPRRSTTGPAPRARSRAAGGMGQRAGQYPSRVGVR